MNTIVIGIICFVFGALVGSVGIITVALMNVAKMDEREDEVG